MSKVKKPAPKVEAKGAKSNAEEAPPKMRVAQSQLAQSDLKKVQALATDLNLAQAYTSEERIATLQPLVVADGEIEAAASAYDVFGERMGATLDTDGARTMIANGKAYAPVIAALERLGQRGRDTLVRRRVPIAKAVQLVYQTMDGLMNNPANADMADAWANMQKARAERLAKAAETRALHAALKQAEARAAAAEAGTDPADPAASVTETKTTVTQKPGKTIGT